jgi:DNA-binding transcriptional LysR family regulator
MSERLRLWLTGHAPSDMSPQAYYAAIHRIQCRNIPLLRSLVREANYITGGPRKLFERELATGTLVELRMDQCDVLYCEPSIGYLKGRTLPPVAHRFIDILRGRGRGVRTLEPESRSRRSVAQLETSRQHVL